MTENAEKICKFIYDKFQASELNNDDLVQIIEQVGNLLNLETIPGAAKRTGKTYNGIKKTKEIREIFGVKYVIDND